MPVKIEDIAQQLDISVSTVSKALNNYVDVSDATRKRVQAVANKLGYFPSASAQSLRRQRTNRIGLAVNYPIASIGEFLAELMIGAALAAERAGFNLILYPTVGQQYNRVARVCQTREVDALLLLWGSQMTRSFALLNKDKMPFVVVTRRVDDSKVPFVVSDNLGGALMLTRHLISLGHRRIAFTPIPELHTTNRDRFAGYRQALKEANIPYDEQLVVPVTMASENRYAAMNQLMDLPDPPTAVFAFHDYVAIDVLRAAADRGLRVPEDVAIAGFDGMHSSLITTPPLTTVKQPVQEMGERAVEVLLNQLTNNLKVHQVVLPVELLPRQSTLGKQ